MCVDFYEMHEFESSDTDMHMLHDTWKNRLFLLFIISNFNLLNNFEI